MKKKLFLVLVLVLFPFNCFALVKPTNDFYVNDYANILDDDVEQYIMQRSVDLEKQTDAQIVVVTVKNLEGMSLEDYWWLNSGEDEYEKCHIRYLIESGKQTYFGRPV